MRDSPLSFSDLFGGKRSHIFCTDLSRFISGGSDQGVSGQVISFPEQSSRSMVNDADDLPDEETLLSPSQECHPFYPSALFHDLVVSLHQ